MNGWKKVKLSDAAIVNPQVKLKKETLYPFVDMAAIEQGKKTVKFSELRAFSGGGSKFENGDTLFARITPCLENGKVAMFSGRTEFEVAHGSTEFIIFRGRPDISNSNFIYYLVNSPEVREFAISQMTGSSGRQRVPTSAFEHITVGLPPLAEQKAIAGVLSALDDKIELNRQMNETLEQTARALFKSWFVDFEPVKNKIGRAKMEGRLLSSPLPLGEGQGEGCGLSEEIAALFPSSFTNSPLGQIPEGWEVKSLDEVANFLNGLALQKYPAKNDDFLPVIKIAELRQGITNNSNKASLDVAKEYIVNDGDVLFSWSGSLTQVLWTGGQGALNQHLFKVTSANPKWFHYYWVEHHLPWFQKIAASKATTMGHIQRMHLKQAKVLLPDVDFMKAADVILQPLLNRRLQCGVENQILSQLRDTILPKLISGELRVGDAGKIIKEDLNG